MQGSIKKQFVVTEMPCKNINKYAMELQIIFLQMHRLMVQKIINIKYT